ncbi:MAG: hypothetical protein Q9187_005394 [Circinaria calcarea]
MLLAAAQRGAKVNIIVYKEVTQALTRKYLSPTLPNYLHSLLPGHTDPVTRTLSGLGLAAIFKSLEYQEAENPLIAPPVPVSSSHTKHALEDLHPNICVFRHPDHLPDRTTFESSFVSSLRNLSLNAATVSKLPGDALKAVYGMNDDVILYWAHHEKLCIVDSKIAFMGGLDLCYGRWDTNQHPIADAHPGNLDEIVFPGQDFNNARIMDFSDVVHWENNKLDRKESSRMGWSDISISLRGPVVKDLREHFVDRWNFIYNEKYDVRQDTRYSRLSLMQNPFSSQSRGNESSQTGDNSGFGFHASHHGRHHRVHDLKERFEDRLEQGMQEVQDQYLGGGEEGGISCQVVRSCSKWSHNVPTEHSVANAYISIIENSQHFVYIENQFFITATSNAQHPVRNKIGGAIVERILRAARAGQKYKVIVLMPAIPAFAGDLKDEASLGTRAIMEFQYNSINRGGHSIMESIAKAGFEPTDYIRFYNLRNYDRINASASMREAEQKSGVDYETARRQHDVNVDLTGYLAQGAPGDYNGSSQFYQRYQQAASTISDRKGLGNNRWDTVSECYMLGGQDIRTVPWDEGDLTEMDAFVLIADDRIVVCGSANLNDRSQLGDHDSEIALIIEDPTPLDSYMNGRPWEASKFAATLRRQLFRKHLGLIPSQDMEWPDPNFEPIGVPNIYDFGSAEDLAVADPLSDKFLNFWNGRAKQNTEAFGKIFHPVPHDDVRTWKDYDAFYERFFHEADQEVEGKEGTKVPAKYRWGHVVAENFSPGEQGVREMKDLLSTVKGTLVEMPLLFLIKEDIAKEGLSLNAFTEVIYT